jgi:putative ABC transport system substrate-binding protein
MMRRREFIVLLGAAAVSWPLAVRAQQPAMPVIGLLGSGSPVSDPLRVAAFLQGLNETGYVEDRNVAIEYRWAEGQYDRLPALAAELVRRQVAAIVISSTVGAGAAKSATATIPIVFLSGSDPVKYGLVASINRPGGNITGVSVITVELLAKQLELLSEVIPNVTTIGLLMNPTNPTTELQLRDLMNAARSLGRQIVILKASSEGNIDAVFESLVEQRVGAIVVGSDSFFHTHGEHIGARAVRNKIPAISEGREFAVAGGLMSYGTGFAEASRQAGVYTGRILKGEKPGDLPVMRPTKFELVINLKTAKALGLTIPPSILARADEVIE